MTIRVLLVDDHVMLREALRMMLEQVDDIDIVGEAGDGQSAVDLAALCKPDVVVMDAAMPRMGGIEATRLLMRQDPKIKVLALTTYTDKRFVHEMLSAGAVGYVAKSTASDQLLQAIRTVAQGQPFFCQEVAGALLESVRRTPSPSAAPQRPKRILALREREVLLLLAEGLSSAEIAARLHIASGTVDVHRRNIMRKLNLHSIAELIKFAIREGLTLV
jgi:two-component system NarL family response regulator